jgi:hypothetical protein
MRPKESKARRFPLAVWRRGLERGYPDAIRLLVESLGTSFASTQPELGLPESGRRLACGIRR